MNTNLCLKQQDGMRISYEVMLNMCTLGNISQVF